MKIGDRVTIKEAFSLVINGSQCNYIPGYSYWVTKENKAAFEEKMGSGILTHDAGVRRGPGRDTTTIRTAK